MKQIVGYTQPMIEPRPQGRALVLKVPLKAFSPGNCCVDKGTAVAGASIVSQVSLQLRCPHR
jgi:hypothetical protein